MSDKNDSKQSSVSSLIDDATARLEKAGVESPRVDAGLLAADLLGVSPMMVRQVREVPDNFAVLYDEYISRRANREPLQHILGSAPFGPLDLEVGPGVFIPRPETEVLADWAVARIAMVDQPVVVDLGTGTGALALYIASHRPDATVYAVERSAEAREFAARNARAVGSSISIVAGDMTDPQLLRELDGTVDLVVTNPPYVPEAGDLQAEVYVDPREAVFSGADGMDAIRGLVPVAARLLKPGGGLGIEHDDTTSQAVRDVVAAHGGFESPDVLRDLPGRERFVITSKLAE